MSRKKNKSKSYDWKYVSVGGVPRVMISSGKDIAHLGELDQKNWTVLSCPASNLHIDPVTLSYLDSNSDGKIRVEEIVAAAKWITSVVKDPDIVAKGVSAISLSEINTENEEGAKIQESASLILKNLQLEKDSISTENLDAYKTGLEERCNAAKEEAVKSVMLASPYGENTEDALAICSRLREKVADYFVRCKLIGFDEECSGAVDVSVEKIAGISGNNLAACSDEIALYPLARPGKEGILPLKGGINPAWQSDFAKFKAIVLDSEFPGAEGLTEAQWLESLSKLDTYASTKDSAIAEKIAEVDKQFAAERDAVAPADKFLHLLKDFITVLHNYVSFNDFFAPDKSLKGAFEEGRLYIDEKCCELCIKVTDMARHNDMAGRSGLFLIYCNCVSKEKNASMKIAAVLTAGNIRNIKPGKNGIFYDRDGDDWDATVIEVIDNPISVGQAFWSPYRKFGNWISSKFDKSAEEKEAASFEKLTSAADTQTEGGEQKKVPFDIAKFAGIFAAIGLALGYIGKFLIDVSNKMATFHWWEFIVLIAAIMLLISGPSMIIAWRKIKRRNLGPVLNANAWAINSAVPVNSRFGRTLTSVAKYPKVALKDPYSEKKSSWKKWVFGLIIAFLAAFAVLYFTR